LADQDHHPRHLAFALFRRPARLKHRRYWDLFLTASPYRSSAGQNPRRRSIRIGATASVGEHIVSDLPGNPAGTTIRHF
jgi:hypothetical protein